MSRDFVIITTINARNEAMRRFEDVARDYRLVIVGDRKTPAHETTNRSLYLGVDDQQQMPFALGRELPFNHYCRKNLGYLWAMQAGARTIYDTDDDNLPYEDWGFPDFLCQRRVTEGPRFVNVYRWFTERFIWPRGFPLDLARESGAISTEPARDVPIGVWQGLADLNPDVDAIYRLLFPVGDIRFHRAEPIALQAGQFCPFNSQNTMWRREAFPLLYLPVTVSFRFTDILRGYVAQRLLWRMGLHLGFTAASVYQERNPHDLMRDFRDETDCYLQVAPIAELLDSLPLRGDAVSNLFDTYAALVKHGFVRREELRYVRSWVNDCVTAMGGRQAAMAA